MFNFQITDGKMRIFTREKWTVQWNIHAKIKNIKTNSKHGTNEMGNKHDKNDKQWKKKNLNWGNQSKIPCF